MPAASSSNLGRFSYFFFLFVISPGAWAAVVVLVVVMSSWVMPRLLVAVWGHPGRGHRSAEA